MKNFNAIEKKLSKLIKFSPFLHSKIKLLYQMISFLFNKQKGFQIQLHEKSRLIDFNLNSTFFGYYDHTPISADMKHFLCHNIIDNSIFLGLYDFSKNKLIMKK